MNTENKEVIVNSVTKKEAKNGKPFLALETNVGKMGVWIESLFDKVNPGKKYNLKVGPNGNFINVVEIIEDLGKAEITPEQVPVNAFQKEAREEKAATMILSHMKDQVIACVQFAATKGIDTDLDVAWKQAYKNVMDHYKQIKGETNALPN